MPYVPHTEKDIEKILKTVGALTVEDLLAGALPKDVRMKGELNLPSGMSEQELTGLLSDLSSKNKAIGEYSSFLGAGAYNHYIPAVVDSLISRSEFFTSYTPYQPEVSQGTLQAIFEYQTLVCQLTGLDVSNASLYDGATAAAEAVLMARRVTGREQVYLSASLHPEYRGTIKTYLKGTGDRVFEIPYSGKTGATEAAVVDSAIETDAACLVVQHPNFFGSIEDLRALADIIHKRKGLLIVVVNEAVSLGMLKPPGELGCDIAVGENRSFGNPLSYGGPYLGFMAVKEEYVRQMPGRIIGETVDKNGKRAFCLTFATREQHIRRERATSNICTNHGLCALAASIHMVSLGEGGLRKLASLNFSKAEYLKSRLSAIKGAEAAFTAPTFNEFTIKIAKDPEGVLKALLADKIIGGLALDRFYPELDRHILIAATELNSRKEIDSFAASLEGALK